MGLVWEGVVAGRITRADWVRLCAEAPARTFGLWPAKGNLRVGADADVVVWDPARDQSLDAAALHMAVDHSPYHGMTVTGWPESCSPAATSSRATAATSANPPAAATSVARRVRHSRPARRREADRAQRAAVRDREPVERQVQLFEQIEREPLRALAFDDGAVG